MTREWLPEVSASEHKDLIRDYPALAKWTRLQGSGRDDWMDLDPMIQAQRPVIREIWVGARSMGCIVGESAETESEGLSASQLDQEDAAELTDLQTMLYHDAATGQPMIEDDETGQWRPITTGDNILIVRGSNDNLDALFLEEGDDPRPQSDHESYGTDHKYSDRYRANNGLEENFLNEPGYKLPNSALPEGTRWQPDDLDIRRLAQELAARIISRNPNLEPQLLSITDEAESRLRRIAKDLSFDNEGAMVAGHFVTRDEFFGTLEANRMAYDAAVQRYEKDEHGRPKRRDYAGVVRKAPPAAMDWEAIRQAS